MKQSIYRRWILPGAAAALAGAAVAALAGPSATRPAADWRRGRLDIFGDFIWARAVGRERAVFADSRGGSGPGDRRCVYSTVDGRQRIKRNNLTSIRPDVAYTVQTRDFRLRSPKCFNAKIMLGYMTTAWRFTHGDGKDLAHWAGADRVVLFVPIRHADGADPTNQQNYFISPYAAQTVCVVEFKAGEAIQYDWFRGGPGKLNGHVLLDLAPFCADENDLKPCVNRPLFRFEVFDNGRWRVSIERDGRDGLAGGKVDGDFDLVFTETSDGAKPYSVNLGRRNAFTLTIYHPSSDETPSEMLLEVMPFDRRTGQLLPAFDRRAAAKDLRGADLDAAIRTLTAQKEKAG